MWCNIVTPLPLFGGGIFLVGDGQGGFSVSPHFDEFQLLMLIIYCIILNMACKV